MHFTSLLITLVTFAATLARADISINNPVAGTVWMSGQSAIVSWIPAGSGFDPNAQSTVELMEGNPLALVLIGTLGTTQETAGSITVQVPANLTTNSDYVVRIGQRYSHAFTINATSGGGNTTGGSGNTTGGGNTTTGNSSGNATSGVPSVTVGNPPAASAAGGRLEVVSTVSMAGLIPVAVVALTWF